MISRIAAVFLYKNLVSQLVLIIKKYKFKKSAPIAYIGLTTTECNI